MLTVVLNEAWVQHYGLDPTFARALTSHLSTLGYTVQVQQEPGRVAEAFCRVVELDDETLDEAIQTFLEEHL